MAKKSGFTPDSVQINNIKSKIITRTVGHAVA
jgi:hypothetical protein